MVNTQVHFDGQYFPLWLKKLSLWDKRPEGKTDTCSKFVNQYKKEQGCLAGLLKQALIDCVPS